MDYYVVVNFMRIFSFWKPDPIPEDDLVSTSGLLPLGSGDDVLRKIMTVPGMTCVTPEPPWEMLWLRGDGVMLRFQEDESPIAPGMVINIKANSHVQDTLFYKLYVQLFERMETTVLEEHSGLFLTPMKFKNRRC